MKFGTNILSNDSWPVVYSKQEILLLFEIWEINLSSRKHVLRFSVLSEDKAAHTKYFSRPWTNCLDKKRERIYQSQRQWRTWDLAAASQLRKSNGGCDLSWPVNIHYTTFCIIIFLRGFPCIDSSFIETSTITQCELPFIILSLKQDCQFNVAHYSFLHSLY